MESATQSGGLVKSSLDLIKAKYYQDALNVITDIGLLSPSKLDTKKGKSSIILQPFGMKGERKFEDGKQIFKLWETRTKRIVFHVIMNEFSFSIETFYRGPWEVLLERHIKQLRENGKKGKEPEERLRLKRRPRKITKGDP